jgi:type IV pilus assembly protein PilO
MTDRMVDRLLLWLPAGLGGVVALLVLGLGAAPLLSQLQSEGRQLEQKQALEQRLPQIRVELSRLAGAQQQAERQQQQVLTLIAGSGELVTFLAQVDRLAQRHRVQLQLFEPTNAQPQAPAAEADPLKAQAKGTRAQQQQNQQQQTAAPPDPLQKAGLSGSRLLLSARGTFPDLLVFLRSIESLSLLVVQSNLNLNQALPDKLSTSRTPTVTTAAAPATTPPAPPAAAPSGSGLVELKLALALYRPAPRR